MSQELEDVKPKLNLSIAYDGAHITVKVKPNMKFTKIFEAAEKRFGKEPGTFKFTYEGQRIGKEDTPASLEMADGDQIDAFLEQVAVVIYRGWVISGAEILGNTAAWFFKWASKKPCYDTITKSQAGLILKSNIQNN